MLELTTAIVKSLGYAAALTAAGTALAQATLARASGTAVPALGGLARWAGVIVVITAGCMAFLYVERLGGEADSAALDAVLRSPLGAALALHAAGGLWLSLAAGRRAAPVGALLILVAFGVVGHSASRGLLTSATIVLHVSAAAWWLGGLWLLLCASRRLADDNFAALLRAFSNQATWIVSALVAAALATAALLIDFRFDPALAYQQGLIAKLGATLALLVIAVVNRLVLSPSLLSNPKIKQRLRLTIGAELLLFAAIVSVTGWLTTYASPHDADHESKNEEIAAQVNGPIAIIDPWAPANPGGAGTAAGYMVIVNNQPVEDRLMAAQSPWAEHVSLHASSVKNRMALMREIDALSIPAHGRIKLRRGVYHLMFSGLYAPFVERDTIPVELIFERAGKVEILLRVRGLDGAPVHEHK